LSTLIFSASSLFPRHPLYTIRHTQYETKIGNWKSEFGNPTILVGWLYKVAFVFNATVDAGKTLPQKLVLRTALAKYTKPAKNQCQSVQSVSKFFSAFSAASAVKTRVKNPIFFVKKWYKRVKK
jgi:hypothetical protein